MIHRLLQLIAIPVSAFILTMLSAYPYLKDAYNLAVHPLWEFLIISLTLLVEILSLPIAIVPYIACARYKTLGICTSTEYGVVFLVQFFYLCLFMYLIALFLKVTSRYFDTSFFWKKN